MVALVKVKHKREYTNRVIYSDLNVSRFINRDVQDIVINRDIEAVKESIINLLMTVPGERLFDDTIGSGIKNILFENISPQTTIALRETIRSSIENNEPRAQVIDIIVSPLPDDNAYAITVTFTVININDPITLELLLNRIR